MFFAEDTRLKKRSHIKALPEIPDTGWRAPTYFPNLSDAKWISFDLERKENDWAHGPGWARGQAETVGFSVGAIDDNGNTGAWYYPIGHYVEPHDNLDRAQCLSWLRWLLSSTPHIPKVGANLLYDIGSLTDDNIKVTGRLLDVQFAEAILHTDGFVNLDFLGNKYLGEGKETNLLYEWCAAAYGGKPNGDQRDNIWRAPPRLAGPYGETDALHPLRILPYQLKRISDRGNDHVLEMECGLIPLLVQMRLEGVSINFNKAEELYAKLKIKQQHLYQELYDQTGFRLDSVNAPKQLAQIFDHVGISYPRTIEGNPSFRKDWLSNLDHPIADLINYIRNVEKIRNTFIKGYILERSYKGKIHCQFHPLRTDRNGTLTARFASSDPNLQNIPIRPQEHEIDDATGKVKAGIISLGQELRQCFIPDNDHLEWDRSDYSQIEYRDLAHFAVGKGSDELRARYNNDPDTDYHKDVQHAVKTITGIFIERRPIKNLNFGLLYTMGKPKLARQNGFSPKQANEVFAAYHEACPYVKSTVAATSNEAQSFGYITTVLGRQIEFNTWEPLFDNYGDDRKPGLPYELALREYGSVIKRAGTHKAINYRLQGSAAEHIKMGMYLNWRDGVYNYIGVPRIQVHDELGHSVRDRTPASLEAYAHMRRTLETSIPVRVPIRVDHKRGPSWGDCD